MLISTLLCQKHCFWIYTGKHGFKKIGSAGFTHSANLMFSIQFKIIGTQKSSNSGQTWLLVILIFVGRSLLRLLVSKAFCHTNKLKTFTKIFPNHHWKKISGVSGRIAQQGSLTRRRSRQCIAASSLPAMPRFKIYIICTNHIYISKKILPASNAKEMKIREWNLQKLS